MQFRKVPPRTALLTGARLLALSAFHYYTAGFGLLRETTHRGIHLAFVLGLIFLVFAAGKSEAGQVRATTFWRPGGVPLYDWIAPSQSLSPASRSPISSRTSSSASAIPRRSTSRGKQLSHLHGSS